MTVISNRSSISAFGSFELDIQKAELRRSGVPVHLPPQPLKLLVLLASRRGEIVTREEICTELWGAETFVDFEQGVNHCIRSIRAVLEDGAEGGRYIETVPRRGYRFIEPVAVAETGSMLAGPPVPEEAWTSRSAESPVRPRSSLGSSTRRFFLWVGRVTERTRQSQPRVRLAILPFENLTGDPQRACLISGITEEIGTQLTQAGDDRLRVMPACSSKGLNQAAHPVWAARQEGVDYLLGGSVRSAAGRARVNAHLVRVHDETQLWAESYDRTLGDILDFQTEVAEQIAKGARGKLSA